MSIMTYPPASTIGLDIVLDALDAETVRQIVGPGATEQDLLRLYTHPTRDVAVHAIVEDGIFKGSFTFTLGPISSSIGFWVRRGDRRRGLVRAAWEALRDDYGPIYSAGCWGNNAPARALLESLGFTLERLVDDPEGLNASYRYRTSMDGIRRNVA